MLVMGHVKGEPSGHCCPFPVATLSSATVVLCSVSHVPQQVVEHPRVLPEIMVRVMNHHTYPHDHHTYSYSPSGNKTDGRHL